MEAAGAGPSDPLLIGSAGGAAETIVASYDRSGDGIIAAMEDGS